MIRPSGILNVSLKVLELIGVGVGLGVGVGVGVGVGATPQAARKISIVMIKVTRFI